MKVTGIILLVMGAFVMLGLIIGASQGHSVSFTGPIIFIVVGAFLISRANKRKQEEKERNEWSQK